MLRPYSGTIERYSQTARRHQDIARVITDVFFCESQCFFHCVNRAIKQHILGELTVKARHKNEMCFFVKRVMA